MKRKIKTIYKNKIIFAALFIFAALCLFQIPAASSTVSAASKDCRIKVEKDKCVDKINACKGISEKAIESCRESEAEGLPDVIVECRKKKSPAACHKKVEQECKNKRGGELDKCQKEQAKKIEATSSGDDSFAGLGNNKGKYQCGNGSDAVKTKIDVGCLGTQAPKNMGAIEDFVYALVRLLSMGVGIVIIGAIILAGIQYSTSEGNPETTQAAKNRIQSAVVGLIIYIFAFSLLQYLVPGGVFT